MSTMSLFAESIKHPERCGPAEVTSRPGARVLTKPTGAMGTNYDYSLNPYVGCGFGCSYCYAAFFVADEAKRERWGEWIEVKTSALEELQFNESLRGKKVYMSTATDPYQPLEAKVELTREILKLLSQPEHQPTLVIQTRSPLVTRDIDLFRRFENLRVNLSITTDSDLVRRDFEPGCSSIERRLEAARELVAAGIKVGICVSPMLPILRPHDFADTLEKIGASRYAWSDFHSSDRLFAASTRNPARQLLAQFGWGRGDFERVSRIFEARLARQGNAFAA